MLFPLSLAHLVGISALQLSLLLLFFDTRWAALPLGLFLLVCFFAPFFPKSSFFLPVLQRGSRRKNTVALSFDDGPDAEVTPRLLSLLNHHGIKAIFFLIGEKAQAHPEWVQEILRGGHEIGNHSWSHDTLLMLKGKKRISEEVRKAQDLFKRFGFFPKAFRPPVGITAPPLWPVLLGEGLYCVNYSCRAFDAGNRRIKNLSGRILQKVRGGDLILLHDVKPHGASVDEFLAEIERLILGLKAKGLDVVSASQLLERNLMGRCGGTFDGTFNGGPAQTFYDDLAETYDHEQFETAVAHSRKLELKQLKSRLPELLNPTSRVLDVGAGTGIFTLEMAPLVARIEAVDLSSEMLFRLQNKACALGLQNINIRQGNAESMAFQGPYDLVTSFLAFEYFQNLGEFFKKLAPHMAPGSRIYFMTARTCPFRFFTQIGNALRQGLWLSARRKRELIRMLKAAGFENIRCEKHLLKCPILGGMLWEVEAQMGASVGKRVEPVAVVEASVP